MIGVNILNNANQFTAAYDIGGDIAVHTYTHPYMTTLSNIQIVAQVCFKAIQREIQLNMCFLAWLDHGNHSQLNGWSSSQVLETTLW